MMPKEIQYIIDHHLTAPVCQTLHGCKKHLEFCSCDELKFLCRFMNCSINKLVERFWQEARA